MTYPNPVSAPPPDWSYCGHGADPTDDPVGCRGIHVAGTLACLVHMEETDRAAYLGTLTPGAPIDHRGTPFDQDLLHRLLDALSDPAPGRPTLGSARFDGATFSGHVSFDGVTFTGDAGFGKAAFTGDASFDDATFTGNAWFGEAIFAGDARFRGVTFAAGCGFRGVTFTRDASFNGTRFAEASRVGPLVCGGRVVMDGVVFGAPVMLEIAARAVSLTRARWDSRAALRLRYAEVDLSDAVLEYPVTVTAHPTAFPRRRDEPVPEGELVGRDAGVRLTSVSGVDTAHLALHDIDLSGCRFAGAVHLDLMKVDGWCTFAPTPTHWNRRYPWWWSRRNTLPEEHHWRVRTARHSSTARGWTPPPPDAPELRPAAVAALYRQMRKSLEDSKNEPDAADFYYGECEMRRHDATRPRGERLLLTAYWALSGYGLRTLRALAWLGTAMITTVLLLMAFGIPQDSPKQEATGTVPAGGGKIALEIDKADPRNPTGARFTGERFEKALSVTLNSVVFRSSGQDLTTSGTYIEMASRVTEPVLLGLAVLAIRNRVKR
ncbi:hypothetical protein GCM10011583_08780 [Streptomyces camponoticapitis]|uniref:Pentapeptide repeat-containing protein n=1 Tax=Streptomyces camponoticapitis TaxID=1616125 RepID=A0ABQ2DZB7_9ACTN|nr:pentapeptide repeat-containing protein [Streptomyces camponoticapitis]GGJ79440.1 hypothetical protein GCM10011583_08780 [Streptomyces camponoticapitis]